MYGKCTEWEKKSDPKEEEEEKDSPKDRERERDSERETKRKVGESQRGAASDARNYLQYRYRLSEKKAKMNV